MTTALSSALPAALLQQLAAATRHGLPLAEVAAILARDPETVPHGAPASCVAALAAGQPLAQALQQTPRLAAPATLQWLALAGQQHLPAALQAWGDDLELVQRGQRARRLALLWPSTLALAVLALWVVLALFVMPAFAEVFANFGTALPLPSRVVFAATRAVGGWWWLWAPLTAVFVWAVWRGKLPRVLRRPLQQLAGRLGVVARWRAAVFGQRLVQLLAAHPDDIALQAAALGHLAATTEPAHWAAVAQRLQTALQAGQALSASLQSQAQLPPRLAAFVAVGERCGQPAAALATLAERAAEALQDAQARFERSLVLGVYLLLGLSVGALVVAVYLPIFVMGSIV